MKSPSAIKESKKEMHSPNELTPPRTIQKKTAYKSSTHRDTSLGGQEGRARWKQAKTSTVIKRCGRSVDQAKHRTN